MVSPRRKGAKPLRKKTVLPSPYVLQAQSDIGTAAKLRWQPGQDPIPKAFIIAGKAAGETGLSFRSLQIRLLLLPGRCGYFHNAEIRPGRSNE